MDALAKTFIDQGVMTQEQYDALVEEQKHKNATGNPVLNDIGQTLMITLQNDNQLGQLVMSLLMEISVLKSRVEVLENA
jgi:hypothetical protein